MENEDVKNLMKEAIAEFLASPEGEQQIGEIVLKAVNISLGVEMDIEKFDKDKQAHVAQKERVNVLHFLAKYLPQIEGRLLGVQNDANKTYNTIGAIARSSLREPKKVNWFKRRIQ